MASLNRAAQACARCRRQKLRCDDIKPCTNCTRSRALCQPPEPSKTSGLKRPRSPISDDVHGDRLRKVESPDASNNFHVDRESLKTVVLSKDSSVVDPAPVRVAHHVLGNVQGTDGKMIVADAESTPPHSARWSLKDLTMPSARLMWLFIDAYFERVHWFVFLFHEPSFRREARELLSAPFWSNSDRGKVVVMLQMAAVGLHTAQFDNGWSGLQALQAYSLSPESLVKKMVSEAQLHLLDVLEDCRIEAVQLSILLSIFHVYLGSRNLAWAMSALAIRMSYSLSIESEYSSGDLLTQQVRYRVWNHMTISDAFCALVYGRQGMIDINLSGPHDLRELDDTCLDSSLKTATLKYGDISTMSFHLLKAKLHEVICRIIASFRQLRFDRSVTETDMLSILRAIQEAEMSLEQWRRGLPVFFNHLSWSSPDPWETFEEEFNYLPSSARENAQILFRQATILQITYDGAIIMTHRKLLECKLPDNPRKEISGFLIDSIQRSLDTAAQAAFRISKVPFHRLDNHLAIHFVCMHAFTAGAILLIKMVNPSDTKSAMLARAAILRIIKACQTMRDKNRIARHADDLLSEMLRATLDSGIDEEASSSSPTMATTETLERPSSKNGVPTQNDLSDTMTSIQGQQWPGSELHDVSAFHYQTSGNDLAIDDFLSDKRQLDERLDEAFGTFGEVIFNVLPGEQLNSWSWGRSSN